MRGSDTTEAAGMQGGLRTQDVTAQGALADELTRN